MRHEGQVTFKNLDNVKHHGMGHEVIDPFFVVSTIEAWKLVSRNGERLGGRHC